MGRSQKQVSLPAEVWDCLGEIARRHYYGSSRSEVARAFILARLHDLDRSGELSKLGVALAPGREDDGDA